MHQDVPESGNYSDTLDCALYGICESLLTIAQSSCIDILDKVAVATSKYLDLPHPKGWNKIYFANLWFDKRKSGETPSWVSRVCEEIKSGNTALLAITEVALDLEEAGFLSIKRKHRNSSTHRFTVLHDIGVPDDNQDSPIDHTDIDLYKRNRPINLIL